MLRYVVLASRIIQKRILITTPSNVHRMIQTIHELCVPINGFLDDRSMEARTRKSGGNSTSLRFGLARSNVPTTHVSRILRTIYRSDNG